MEVTYVDHMGDDLRVVNSARVSFNKEVEEFKDQDVKLIRYLANHNHWTPFSHCMVTLREQVPIFVARQRFKHMVGFAYNEVSRRYVDDKPELYWPDKWRKRPDGSVKQGSSDEEYKSDDLKWAEHHVKGLVTIYNKLIADGCAPEQARMILPQNMYTEYYVTGSLAAWARAYKLRIDSHAQKEIQDLAKVWGNVIEPLFPVSWEALTKEEREENERRN